MTDPTLTDLLLAPILEADPAGPRVTYYDDATGERIELSALTLANWAAKTANFLRDEVGVAPGDAVRVDLPAHWQTAAVLLGAWWAGAHTVVGAGDGTATVALVTAAGLEDADESEVAALSLDPFGRALPDLPIGVTDYATAVRVHGDAFVPSGTGPALGGRSAADLVADARRRATDRSWDASSRVLSTAAWPDAEAVVDGLVAVLAAGASLVQVANADPAAQERRRTTEKVTASFPA